VRWRQTLHGLADTGCVAFVELGPGNVLTGMAKRTVTGGRPLSVSSPDDVDRLIELVAAPESSAIGVHEGEHLFATERLVVSPAAGVFEPVGNIGEGVAVEPGQVVGTVGEHDVRTPFAGTVMGVLAVRGERVAPSQPIAWLRGA
jgi:[acyl-carrier-protein] S-malonyltransferase